MSRIVRWSIALFLLGVLFSSGVALMHAGAYGFTVFVIHPYFLGALSCWVLQPARRSSATWCGVGSIVLASAVLCLVGIEGAICIALSLPLTLTLGVVGARRAYRSQSSQSIGRAELAMLLLVPPATFAYDTHAQPAIYAVTTRIEIAAPPQKVWEQIVHLEKFPEPKEWYFHTGLAYPQQVRLDGEGPGATRYCEFTTGAVVEAIEVWDAPHLLRFRVVQNPAPMREWTPYKEVEPKHLHGYLISREGEFRLTPLPGNRTLLEGTSWYQHGLWPASYWRVWSDAVFHRIHLRVFHQIQALAEQS